MEDTMIGTKGLTEATEIAGIITTRGEVTGTGTEIRTEKEIDTGEIIKIEMIEIAKETNTGEETSTIWTEKETEERVPGKGIEERTPGKGIEGSTKMIETSDSQQPRNASYCGETKKQIQNK